MVLSKYIISAIAGATSALAVSCSSSSPTTVQNQGDASAIANCPTYTGDIHINSGAGPSLDFGKISKITGELSMDSDSQLTSLMLSSLTNLGSLSLTNLTTLATLQLGSLTDVGDMTLKNLPILRQWDFGSNLQSAGDVIVENVQISDLGALSTTKKLNSITLSNCQFLQNIQFAVNEIDFVDIGPNNVQQGQTVNFKQLTTATTLTFRNSTAVNTPMLNNVSQTLSLIGNTFSSFGAQNLSWVGAFVFADNPQVANISFPNLIHINGSNSTLDIQNNTMLSVINGFPKLIDVTNGDLIFAGNIKNISFPDLTNIAGAVTVDTTDSNFDCTGVNAWKSNQTAKGDVNCKTGDSTPVGSTGSTSTGGSGSGSGSGSPSNPAAHTELPLFMTTGLFAALLALLA